MSIVDSQDRLSPTQAALIGLMRMGDTPPGRELTGGELARKAKAVIGDYWTITRSQVYRELAVLAERGLLEAGPPGPRESRPFRVTEAGDAAFLSWLDGEPGDDTVRLPILLSVLFGGELEPGRLAEILDGYERRHRERLARYRALEVQLAGADVEVYARVTLSFGIFHEAAVLGWIDSLPAALRRRDRSGARPRAQSVPNSRSPKSPRPGTM